MRLARLLLVSFVTACGGQIDAPPEAVPAAPPTSTTPDVPPLAAPTLGAFVHLTTNEASGLEAQAHFPTSPTSNGSFQSGCQILANDPPSTSEPEPDANAGEITIDLPDAVRALTLTYDAKTHAYLGQAIDAPPLPSGAPINVRGEGVPGGIPAFTTSVPIAAQVQIQTPLEGALVSPDSGDLDVTWSKIEAPIFIAGLAGLADVSKLVVCSFQAGEGHGVIPSTLVQQVAKCGGGPCNGAVLRIVAGHTTSVVAGDYKVAVTHVVEVFRTLKFAQ